MIDDYRAVLPLPKGRFFARSRVRRPLWTQQCGPFGRYDPSELPVILAAALPHRRFRGFPLREGLAAPPDLPLRQRTNLVLDLTAADVRFGYGKTLRKKLRRHPQAELHPVEIGVVAEAYHPTVGEKNGLSWRHYSPLIDLAQASAAGYNPELLGLSDSAGRLLAAGFFPAYGGRCLNLFAASTPAGYQHDGMARLLAAVIDRRRAAGDHLFDFEGSDLPGVATFFRQFGPEERPYLTF